MSATAAAIAVNQYRKGCGKLFFEHGGKSFDLKDLIGPFGAHLTDILHQIDPSAKIEGSDPVYTRVYRRIKYLARKGLFELVRKERIDWDKTRECQEQEIQNSVRAIFAAAVQKDTPPLVSSGTSPTEAQDPISTVKVRETALTVVPTGQLFYLFSQVQNSNPPKESANTRQKWYEQLYRIPAKCSTERVTAIKTLMDIQGRALFQRDCTCPLCGGTGQQQPGKGYALCGKCGYQWRPPLNNNLVKPLRDVQLTFGEWEDRTLNKELFFDRGPGSQIVKLPCRTRFTDKGRKVHNIKTYDRAWGRANQLFQRGVFVTLTTDPSLHKSLWHANRHLSRAFNRYLSLLLARKKRNAKKGFDSEEENDKIDNGIGRLKYISAYEFQENGLIHLHAVFFGIRYLAKIDDIAEDWQRCGQGRIVHAYGIRKEGDTWHWNREQPKDAEGRSPVDYLRKYLEKALYVSESFGMYWAVNKRFCSMSRMFQTKECQGCRAVWGSALRVCPDCGAPLRRISQGFRFIGALEKGSSPTAEMMQRHRWPILNETGPGVPA